MKIPPNMTEQEVLDTILKIAKSVSYKYRFGCYTADDIHQEAVAEGLLGLEKYDGRRPLENFLRVHISFRMRNLRRNKYERLDKPCDDCPLSAYIKDTDSCKEFDNMEDCELYEAWFQRNSQKKNLMGAGQEALDINGYEENLLDNIADQEIIDNIEQSMNEAELRKDWLKFKNGVKLPRNRMSKIMEKIKSVIGEEYGQDR